MAGIRTQYTQFVIVLVMKRRLHDIWFDYQSEFYFGIILSALLVLSAWLSRYIPEEVFDEYINPAMSVAFAAICFYGAVLCFIHHKGVAARRLWATILITMGVWEIVLLVLTNTLTPTIMRVGTTTFSSLTIVVACVFAWLLLLYPTEVLRPGWLNLKFALLELSLVVNLGLLDYFVPLDLRWLIALYPVGLMAIISRHAWHYRRWCEENFSSFDDIDVQWIVRYLVMMSLSGIVFYWMCLSSLPTRAFTQQWFLMFILAYTTERVLYRPDPWKRLRTAPSDAEDNMPEEPSVVPDKAMLEEWMDAEKPYRNPDFQLQDLQQVLPLNRTYLSRFIKTEYDCSFYQLVTRYRVEEAKRLLHEHPQMKIQEISEQCGFSSPTIFTRVFTRETGLNPSEWK